MKKYLILAFICILALVLVAQETITIGNPNSGMGVKAPIYPFNDNSFSQMLFTSEELAEAGFIGGQISQIMFQARGNLNLSGHGSWNIRMMETSATNLKRVDR